MSRYFFFGLAESFLRRLALGNVLAEDGAPMVLLPTRMGLRATPRDRRRQGEVPSGKSGQRTAIERREEPHSFLVEPGLSGALPMWAERQKRLLYVYAMQYWNAIR